MNEYDDLYNNYENFCKNTYLLKFTIKGQTKEIHLCPTTKDFEHLSGLHHLKDIQHPQIRKVIRTVENDTQHNCDCIKDLVETSTDLSNKDAVKSRLRLVNSLKKIILEQNGKNLKIYSSTDNSNVIGKKIGYDYVLVYSVDNLMQSYIFLKKSNPELHQVYGESYFIISCFTKDRCVNLSNYGRSFEAYKETPPTIIFSKTARN